jgi:predicted outer membrane repeat protein
VPYWLDASATFDAVTFSGNQGTVGGALYVDFGTPQAVVSGTGCVFENNRAGVKARCAACMTCAASRHLLRRS